jgi:hypothetical protein
MDLQSFVTQWADTTIPLPSHNYTEPSKQPYRLRPSRLGRPAYVTVIDHLIHLHGNKHAAVDNTEYYGRVQDIFRTGHDVEARLVEVMRSSGIQGIEYQVPTAFDMHGYTIEGTADVVLDDTVIDIKTASASNFKRLLSGYNDLTYRTQLALYAHGMGLKRVALLLYNKDTSELQLKYIPLTNELERVRTILCELRKMETLNLEDALTQLFDMFSVSDPVLQMRNKVPTGRYLLPPELYYEAKTCDVLWRTEYIDGTRYITDINEDPAKTIRERYSE